MKISKKILFIFVFFLQKEYSAGSFKTEYIKEGAGILGTLTLGGVAAYQLNKKIIPEKELLKESSPIAIEKELKVYFIGPKKNIPLKEKKDSLLESKIQKDLLEKKEFSIEENSIPFKKDEEEINIDTMKKFHEKKKVSFNDKAESKDNKIEEDLNYIEKEIKRFSNDAILHKRKDFCIVKLIGDSERKISYFYKKSLNDKLYTEEKDSAEINKIFTEKIKAEEKFIDSTREKIKKENRRNNYLIGVISLLVPLFSFLIRNKIVNFNFISKLKSLIDKDYRMVIEIIIHYVAAFFALELYFKEKNDKLAMRHYLLSNFLFNLNIKYASIQELLGFEKEHQAEKNIEFVKELKKNPNNNVYLGLTGLEAEIEEQEKIKNIKLKIITKLSAEAEFRKNQPMKGNPVESVLEKNNEFHGEFVKSEL